MHHKYSPVEADEGSESDQTLLRDVSDRGRLIDEKSHILQKRSALILHSLLLFINLFVFAGTFICLKYHQGAGLTYSRFDYRMYTPVPRPKKSI